MAYQSRVKLESGDAILIRTGRWARRAAEGLWNTKKNTAGLPRVCLPWLKKHDVAVVGSDLATDVLALWCGGSKHAYPPGA